MYHPHSGRLEEGSSKEPGREYRTRTQQSGTRTRTQLEGKVGHHLEWSFYSHLASAAGAIILDRMSTTPLRYEHFDVHVSYLGTGPYRAADYWQLPESEPVELVRGRLMMSPSPTPYHQTLVVLLAEMLSGIARQSGGLVYCAPMDVVLADDTILQPDLLYIAKNRCDIVQNRIEGPPDLVIEILSEGTERRDRLEKLDLYALH